MLSPSTRRPCRSCARVPCEPEPSSTGAAGVAAVLVAHPEEPTGAGAGVLHDSRLRPAGRAEHLLRRVPALLCRLRLLLGHRHGARSGANALLYERSPDLSRRARLLEPLQLSRSWGRANAAEPCACTCIRRGAPSSSRDGGPSGAS